MHIVRIIALGIFVGAVGRIISMAQVGGNAKGQYARHGRDVRGSCRPLVVPLARSNRQELDIKRKNVAIKQWPSI